MRLAIVRKRHARFGGAERFIDSMLPELSGAGIDLSIVAEEWHGAPEYAIQQVAVTPGGATRRGRLVHFQREVAALVAANTFDLVQTHERLTTADIFRAGDGVHAAWLARLAAAYGPWRAMLRRFDGRHRLLVETERKMARDTGMVFVANSGLVAREIAEWLHVPGNRIRTIENGVDRTAFRPPTTAERTAARQLFNLDADSPVVAYVGSGFQRKGAFELLDALALPECREVRALIAGRDRTLETLRRRAAVLGLDARVQILGGYGNPVAIYHAADAFVLPSLYDPMPNAALEALSCGLPLVVTADTGIADAVGDHGAGAIVTRDPGSIAQGLSSTLRDRAVMAKAAEALAPRFDLKAATPRWLALYRELQ